MRRSRTNGNDTAIVYVFEAVQQNGRMVDGIQLEAQETLRHLSGHASGEVVHEEMDIHHGMDVEEVLGQEKTDKEVKV